MDRLYPMDRCDHDDCRALLARYFRRFAEAWRRGDWGVMQFCNRRILVLRQWQRELGEGTDLAEV